MMNTTNEFKPKIKLVIKLHTIIYNYFYKKLKCEFEHSFKCNVKCFNFAIGVTKMIIFPSAPTFVENHFIHSYCCVRLIYTYIVLIVFLEFLCIIMTDSTGVLLFIFNLFSFLFSPLYVLIIEQAIRTLPKYVFFFCLNLITCMKIIH